MILTDNRSYQSESIFLQPLYEPFEVKGLPAESEEILLILDAGKTFNNGNPPSTIKFNDKELPNPRKDASPQSILGSEQKRWLLSRLRESQAAWKIWGNSFGMLELRLDLQNLPSEIEPKWTYPGYGFAGGGDWSGYRTERNEILALLRREKITGLIKEVEVEFVCIPRPLERSARGDGGDTEIPGYLSCKALEKRRSSSTIKS